MPRKSLILIGTMIAGVVAGLFTLSPAPSQPISAQQPESTLLFLPVISTASEQSQIEAMAGSPEAWPTFEHTYWGITFQYPPGWEVYVPDFEGSAADANRYAEEAREGTGREQVEHIKAENLARLGYSLRIYPAGQENSPVQVQLALNSYLLSPGGTLEHLIQLQRQKSSLVGSFPLDPPLVYRHSEDGTGLLPPEFDQIVTVMVEHPRFPGRIFWVSHQQLVFSVKAGPEGFAVQERILTSLTFDHDRYADIREHTLFNGNEHDLAREIQEWENRQQVECDIVCRDRLVSEKLQSHESGNEQPTEDSLSTPTTNENDMTEVGATSASALSRKALPGNWHRPIFSPNSIPVNCGSEYHTGEALYAVDASVYRLPVYAMVDGTVVHTQLDNNGYGENIILRTTVWLADELRYYYHRYAHLESRNATLTVGSTVGQGGFLGTSGNTSGLPNGHTWDYHLHFHIYDAANRSVDPTPVLGFNPNLYFPSAYETCGYIRRYIESPIILEAVAFTHRYQPRNNHYWLCYNSVAHGSPECYMESTPNNGMNITYPFSPLQSPELGYNNVYDFYSGNPQTFYVWGCGNAPTTDDGSIHVGTGGTPSESASNMTAWGNPQWLGTWTWQSWRANGTRPTVNLVPGLNTLNVWMKKDGMRLGRILLTPDVSYIPTDIQCAP